VKRRMISDLHDDERRMIVSSSEDAIKRVVEAFERSDWSEIDVRSGDLRVHLSTSAPTSPHAPTPDRSPIARSTRDDVGDVAPASNAESPATASAPAPPGAHVVVSPSPGIFWRSPEPGVPPFMEVGQTVEASATLCIIEVMKLMNHLKAGVAGEVIAVYGENGAAVRKGEPLFAIVPLGSSS
jgi:acetyl-CoA carboxylase biotin carboxyl carrier protein